MKYIKTTSGQIIPFDENANEMDKPMILHSQSNVVAITDSIEQACDYYLVVVHVFEKDAILNICKTLSESLSFVCDDADVYGVALGVRVDGVPYLRTVAKFDKEEKKLKGI